MAQPTTIREIRGKYPPNVATIAKFFPIRGQILFAYAPDIYNPRNTELLPCLLEHETEHIRSQLSYDGGVEAWWTRYCLDPVFRLAEEVMGHTAEMMHRLRTEAGESKNRQARIVQETADRLRAPLYGWKMSRNKAADLLMQHGSRLMDLQHVVSTASH